MMHAVKVVEITTANHLDRFLLLKQTWKIQWQHASPDVRGQVPWVHFKDLPPFPWSLPSPKALRNFKFPSNFPVSLRHHQLPPALLWNQTGLRPKKGASQNSTGSGRTRESTRTMSAMAPERHTIRFLLDCQPRLRRRLCCPVRSPVMRPVWKR